MAKATIKKTKGPSIHSRAARRATSPSINTDKSLKQVQLPSAASSHRPAVLGLHHNAGVSKKAKRGRKAVPSTRARARHARGLARAEAVVDRTAARIQKSKQAASMVETRKKSWDAINAAAGKASSKGANMFAGLAVEADGDGWEEVVDELDDEMAEAAPADSAKGLTAGEAPAPAPAASLPLNDDNDIL